MEDIHNVSINPEENPECATSLAEEKLAEFKAECGRLHG
jgi:hypothetical protein